MMMHAQVAQRSVATAAARYGAARSALGLLGPLTWAWLGADLVMRALGTDYCRVVRAVFALAQVTPPPLLLSMRSRAGLRRQRCNSSSMFRAAKWGLAQHKLCCITRPWGAYMHGPFEPSGVCCRCGCCAQMASPSRQRRRGTMAAQRRHYDSCITIATALLASCRHHCIWLQRDGAATMYAMQAPLCIAIGSLALFRWSCSQCCLHAAKLPSCVLIIYLDL